MDFESLTFSKDNIIDEDGCGNVPFTEIVANHKHYWIMMMIMLIMNIICQMKETKTSNWRAINAVYNDFISYF